jgi:hypothetical protein
MDIGYACVRPVSSFIQVSSAFNEQPCRHFYDVAPYLRREREEMSFMRDETLLP